MFSNLKQEVVLGHSRSSSTSRRGSAVCSLSTVFCLSVIPGRSLRNRYSRFLRGIQIKYDIRKHSSGKWIRRNRYNKTNTHLSLCSAMRPLSVTFPHDTTSIMYKLSCRFSIELSLSRQASSM